MVNSGTFGCEGFNSLRMQLKDKTICLHLEEAKKKQDFATNGSSANCLNGQPFSKKKKVCSPNLRLVSALIK